MLCHSDRVGDVCVCVCGVAGGGLGGGNQVGYDWGVGEEEVSVVAGVHIELMHLGWGVDGSTKCTEGVFVCTRRYDWPRQTTSVLCPDAFVFLTVTNSSWNYGCICHGKIVTFSY